MSDEPTFDIQAAHRYFSTECFNRAWDLIEKEDRTAEEEDEMLNLSLASLWHWTRRPDCTSKERSLGYWQVSRIYAITGRPKNATWYAERCREATEDAGLPPFYLGYAYEALARAGHGRQRSPGRDGICCQGTGARTTGEERRRSPAAAG